MKKKPKKPVVKHSGDCSIYAYGQNICDCGALRQMIRLGSCTGLSPVWLAWAKHIDAIEMAGWKPLKMSTVAAWQPIESAPKDGTRFIARKIIPATYMNFWEQKDRKIVRITWYGKTSHVPLYGWCRGRAENTDLWQPTHWKPVKTMHA